MFKKISLPLRRKRECVDQTQMMKKVCALRFCICDYNTLCQCASVVSSESFTCFLSLLFLHSRLSLSAFSSLPLSLSTLPSPPSLSLPAQSISPVSLSPLKDPLCSILGRRGPNRPGYNRVQSEDHNDLL